MELELERESICMQEELLSDSFEQAIDCEFTLPDYCPDIVKILKCNINTKIISKSIMNKILNIDGCANIELLYLDEENKLIGYELPVNFTKKIDLFKDAVNPEIIIKTKCEYVNCRAASNRRIDIHGAVSLIVNVNSSSQKEILQDSQSCGIQKKTKTMNYKEPACCVDKQFVINDDIEIPDNMGAISRIIRHEEKMIIDEIETITNKVILKGNVNMTALFFSDKGEYEHITQAIPFNYIIDMFGVDEDKSFLVNGEVCCCELKAITAPDGVCKIINANIKLNINIFCYKNKSISTITDAYSTKFNINTKSEKYSNICEKQSLSESFSFSENIDLPSDSIRIIDVLATTPEFTTELKDDKFDLNIVTTLCILTCSSDGKIDLVERKISAHKMFDFNDCDEMDLDSIKIKNLSYTLSQSGKAEVKAEFIINGNLCCKENFIALSDIEINNQKCTENQPALTVYFASKGEELWDIARKYNTETSAIMKVNDMTENVLNTSMPLLIPSVT